MHRSFAISPTDSRTIPLTKDAMNNVEFYRFGACDYRKYRRLVASVGCTVPLLPPNVVGQLIQNLVCRKVTTAIGDKDVVPRLEVFLDLGENEGVLLATFHAGNLNTPGQFEPRQATETRESWEA